MLIRHVARRVVSSIPVVFGVTLLTFLVMHATAGSYIPGLQLNPNLRPEDIERIRSNLGLDRPLWIQYLSWVGGIVLHGDFGRSLVDGTPVTGQILERLPATLELTLTAIVLGVGLSIPLGVAGATRRGKALDHALTIVAVGGFAVPQFWLALLMILLFSVQFHSWGLPSLPQSGAISPIDGGSLLDRLAHLVLPATVLAFFYISTWSRYARSGMIEVLSQDYVRTARAKGMSERRVVYVHALRNAIIPLTTLVGLALPYLFSGALVVEIVFGWPGIGLLAYQHALEFDYTTVMGTTTFIALLVVLGNLISDLLYASLDPRISRG